MEYKRDITELQQKLRKLALKGRWKHSDNFHLTLKFLNEITAQQKLLIDAALKDICSGCRPFSLETGGLGVFSGRDAIRVLWLGLTGDLQQLHALSSDIDKALAVLGFPPEKRSYSPHITLGQDVVFEKTFDQIKESVVYNMSGPVPVRSVTLFKSEQVQNRRIYTKISEYEFIKN